MIQGQLPLFQARGITGLDCTIQRLRRPIENPPTASLAASPPSFSFSPPSISLSLPPPRFPSPLYQFAPVRSSTDPYRQPTGTNPSSSSAFLASSPGEKFHSHNIEDPTVGSFCSMVVARHISSFVYGKYNSRFGCVTLTTSVYLVM